MLPDYMRIERDLLVGFLKHPSDSFGAYNNIPVRTRNLYIHAYQSFLWNRMVTERLTRLGASPVVGDLVIVGDALASGDPYDEVAEDGDSDADDDMSEADEGAAEAVDGAFSAHRVELPKVRALDAGDISSGKFSLQDVVMPLPGHAVEYPVHGCGRDLASELLAEDGLDPETAFSQPDAKHRFLRLPGAYRHVVHRPRDVEWELKTYTSGTEALTTTDFDALRTRKLVPDAPVSKRSRSHDATADAAGGAGGSLGAPDDMMGEAAGEHGDATTAGASGADEPRSAVPEKLALQVSFSLGRSCYATMCIRELTKMSTAQHVQAQMTARSAEVDAETKQLAPLVDTAALESAGAGAGAGSIAEPDASAAQPAKRPRIEP
mmetsp:Transcript_15131/g.52582  ORF Transcript_15131/g.52582 Transcript_15131/m.52582 type:complete len:378 (-) Transcript_15131:117-1250(-)